MYYYMCYVVVIMLFCGGLMNMWLDIILRMVFELEVVLNFMLVFFVMYFGVYVGNDYCMFMVVVCYLDRILVGY